jgi:hypothetical protein
MYVEHWLFKEGKRAFKQRQGRFEAQGPSMGKAKAVRRQKGSSKAKTKAILRQRPFEGKGNSPSKARAKAFPMQKGLMTIKVKFVLRKSVNCTTVTSKHPLSSQSLQSWYGLVGDVALPESLCRECCSG